MTVKRTTQYYACSDGVPGGAHPNCSDKPQMARCSECGLEGMVGESCADCGHPVLPGADPLGMLDEVSLCAARYALLTSCSLVTGERLNGAAQAVRDRLGVERALVLDAADDLATVLSDVVDAIVDADEDDPRLIALLPRARAALVRAGKRQP